MLEIVLYWKRIGVFDWLLPFLVLVAVMIAQGVFLVLKDQKKAGVSLIIFSLPVAYAALWLTHAVEIVTGISAGLLTLLLLLAVCIILSGIVAKNKNKFFKPYFTVSVIIWMLTGLIALSSILIRP